MDLAGFRAFFKDSKIQNTVKSFSRPCRLNLELLDQLSEDSGEKISRSIANLMVSPNCIENVKKLDLRCLFKYVKCLQLVNLSQDIPDHLSQTMPNVITVEIASVGSQVTNYEALGGFRTMKNCCLSNVMVSSDELKTILNNCKIIYPSFLSIETAKQYRILKREFEWWIEFERTTDEKEETKFRSKEELL